MFSEVVEIAQVAQRLINIETRMIILKKILNRKILNTNDQASAEHTTTPPGKIL